MNPNQNIHTAEDVVQSSGITWSSGGGLRKIRDVKPPCMSSEHNPPSNIVLDPGEYEYTCPSCGNKTVFVVQSVTC